MTQSTLQVEYPFTLPNGFMDDAGQLHKDGVMRLATAGDELLPMRDPRVRDNPAYAAVIILARVVTKLGSLEMISTQVIENLYAADFAMLNDLYDRINALQPTITAVTCPNCGHEFMQEVGPPSGES